MTLNKEDVALLDSDPRGFLIRAYFTAHPDASLRQASKALGVPYESLRRYTSGSQVGSVFGSQVGSRKSQKNERINDTSGSQVGSVFGSQVGSPSTPSKSPSLTAQLKPVFDQAFRELTGEAFIWSAKEMGALTRLGKSIASSLKAKGADASPAAVLTAFPKFLASIKDPWILEHFSPSLLHSKYNEILSSYRKQTRSATAADRNSAYADVIEAAKSYLNNRTS